MQENTIGTGNVGKSPCGGTNADNQSMKGQALGNLRKHSVVVNQEAIPTGERPGIYSLPRPCPVPLSAAPGHKESNSTNTDS